MTAAAPIPRAARPWWTATVCGMASWTDASVIGAVSTVLVILQQAGRGIGASEVGLLSSLLILGVAVGAIVGGRLADRFGRRRVFVVTVAVVAVSAALLTVPMPVPLIAVLVLLLGLGSGADLPVALSTIAEAAPDQRARGRMLAVSQLLYVLGAIAPGILAIAVGDSGLAGARILLGYLAVLAALVLLGRLTIPESRIWVRAARGLDDAAGAGRAGFRALLRPPHLAAFAGLLVWYALVAQGANTVSQFGSYLLVNVAGLTVAQGATAGFAALPFALLAAVAAIPLLGTRARFPMFVIGSALTVLAGLLVVVVGFSLPVFLLALVLFSIGGGIAGEGLMKFWAQRAFPSLLRGTAQGAVIAGSRFVSAGFAAITPALVGVDPRLLFGVLAAAALIGAVTGFAAFRSRDAFDAVDVERRADDAGLPVAPQPAGAK